MKENIQECLPIIDDSLSDETHPLAGCDPIWILNWLTSHKYRTSLQTRHRIVVSPSSKEELIAWAKSDAFSSNCLSNLPYIDGSAGEKELLKYAKDIIIAIEYEQDEENLKELIRAAEWNLNKTKLILKEL